MKVKQRPHLLCDRVVDVGPELRQGEVQPLDLFRHKDRYMKKKINN
jgi:hypothetical protein